MFKFIVFLLLLFNSIYADQATHKSSELELFLFKIGFEPLLKDVSKNKNKTQLNEDEIIILKNKINFIVEKMNKEENPFIKEEKNILNSDKDELNQLKLEISFLKSEILKLKDKKIKNNISKKENIKEKSDDNQNFIQNALTMKNYSNIKEYPSENSRTLRKVERYTPLNIERCDKFGWCKILGQQEYIAKYLLKFD